MFKHYTGKYFVNEYGAVKTLNISQSCINRVCLGQRKSAKGFIFEYLK